MLTTTQNVLALKGLTLRGSIDLQNPNENLAVIFEVCIIYIHIDRTSTRN
jgi:hypothetical protein